MAALSAGEFRILLADDGQQAFLQPVAVPLHLTVRIKVGGSRPLAARGSLVSQHLFAAGQPVVVRIDGDRAAMGFHLQKADTPFGYHQQVDVRGMQVKGQQIEFAGGVEGPPG